MHGIKKVPEGLAQGLFYCGCILFADTVNDLLFRPAG